MQRIFGWFRRAGELLLALLLATLMTWPVLVYPLVLAGLVGVGVLSFLLVRSHPETATPIVVGVAALMSLSLICSPGVIRADRSGDSLYYRLRSAMDHYKLKLRMRSDSRQNDRKAARLKRSRRKVLAALSAGGPATGDALATRLGLPAAVVDEYLSHAAWRGWVDEVPTDVDGSVHYSLTGRGGRELDAPGSTDHEPL